MSFISFEFIILFVCCFLLYCLAGNKGRKYILLAASSVFIGYYHPMFLVTALLVSLLSYYAGQCIEKVRLSGHARTAYAVTVLLLVGGWIVFRYADKLSGNGSWLFPLGISFYTFQALTYVVDVYCGKVQVQTKFYKMLLYVSMFPQLIAGPIVRYSDVCKQIDERTCSVQKAARGTMRFCVGLFKKAVLANFAGALTEKLLGEDLSTLSFVGAWVGIFAYALQIYFDFSGYSDMAIGLGRIFGFDFPENFRYPYIAKSIQDFWSRWHMTLSSFFRDYLYIPLGGNRKRWALNMLIVWLLTGLWHGAEWNFVLWGLYYFFFLMLEKMYLAKYLNKAPAVIQHLYAVIVILVGWVFFYFGSLSEIKAFFAAAFGANGFLQITEKTVIVNYILTLLVGAVLCLPVIPFCKRIAGNLCKSHGGKIFVNVCACVCTVAAFAISTAALVGSSYNPFLYFRF